MHTFLGLLIGGILGGMTGDFPGALGGGLIGAVAGWYVRRMSATDSGTKSTSSKEESDAIRQLERKTQYLYDQLQLALGRIAKLEAASPSAENAADDASAKTSASAASEAMPAAAAGLTAPTPDFHSSAAIEPKLSPEERRQTADSASVRGVAHTVAAGKVPASREPGLMGQWLRAAREWFTGGNTVVRVGIVILFFGLAFLLKYAYEHSHVPPELRVLAVAIGGLSLMALGWKLRTRRAAYGQALQGGGVGVLYLTIFAAFRLYDLLPPMPAFALMICIAALSAALAVMQNAQALAVLGASGGFLAPVLTSTGAGSHVALFSYFVLLNAGVLAIAWFKAWRLLNWVGFVFTFGIGLLWGARDYRPEYFSTTQPFLILFYAMYLAMSVLYALRQAPRLKHYLDATLIFGLPVVGFGMQSRLMAQHEYGAAVSSLVLAFIYLGLARVLYARHREDLRALVEVFLALGVVFATLAIPLALEARWTSAAWALEGAALVWLGVRQARLHARVFGLLLQAGAVVTFLGRLDLAHAVAPVANSFFLGALFLSVAGLFSNWILEKGRSEIHSAEVPVATALFWWGLLWWAMAGQREIDRWLPATLHAHAVLLFAIASSAVFAWLHGKLTWRLAKYPLVGLLPVATLVLAADHAARIGHPFAHLGWLAWPLLFAAQLWLLRTHEAGLPRWTGVLHAAGLWLFAVVGAWELAWWTAQWIGGGSVWEFVAWALFPGALIGALVSRGERVAWPVSAHWRRYMLAGAAPVVLCLVLWLLVSNFAHDGDPSPLPYLPILTPLDLAQLGVLLVGLHWFRRCRQSGILPAQANLARGFYMVIGAVAFVCANGVLLRTIHHWAGVAFDFDQMMASMLVQAAMSIFWTVLALVAMVIASRFGRRALWMCGAALMAIVVVKLFLVDLSAIGGVERIVSFIGVGVLMLVVGYFSPAPPKRAEAMA